MKQDFKNSVFFRQAKLLLQILPLVGAEDCFALKGGTAINLFFRDMPRLSVDIDLAYIKTDPREASLAAIDAALQRISGRIKNAIPGVAVAAGRPKNEHRANKLLVSLSRVIVKIEPNDVIRGAVFSPVERALSSRAEELFRLSVSIKTLSFADLYGGKICAALDRQHPRDLFDIKILFDNEGLTEDIRKAFIVYLVGHSRPINELLRPREVDASIFERSDIHEMTLHPVTIEELLAAKDVLLRTLRQQLTKDERMFILSFKEGQPDWKLIGLEGIEHLPAVQWKLMNIRRMSKEKHRASFEKLKATLEL